MNKKIVGGVIAGIVGVGGAAVLFNKKRHADDFIGFDTDETETVDVEVEEETKKVINC